MEGMQLKAELTENGRKSPIVGADTGPSVPDTNGVTSER